MTPTLAGSGRHCRLPGSGHLASRPTPCWRVVGKQTHSAEHGYRPQGKTSTAHFCAHLAVTWARFLTPAWLLPRVPSSLV